jgi:type I restriction enzyme M protein
VSKRLIDAYDVYQHLMDYWSDTMQDDCYLIASDGWKATTYPVIEAKKNKDGKVIKEIVKGWACDLIPKVLIVARYFGEQQTAIDQLGGNVEAISAEKRELEEENSAEDDAFGDMDKISRANVIARFKEIKEDPEAKDEASVLCRWLELSDQEAEVRKKLKEAEATLDASVYAQYPKLSDAEVQSLVADEKWLRALESAMDGELDRISHSLTQRLRELATRYRTPMPRQTCVVEELENRVTEDLQEMGFTWD